MLGRRIIPESVRWMITAGKIDDALEELKCIAKHNGKKLSDESMEKLEMYKSIADKEIVSVDSVLLVASFDSDTIALN